MNSKRIVAFIIDFIITAMIMNIPFRILVMYPTIIEGKHWKKARWQACKNRNHGAMNIWTFGCYTSQDLTKFGWNL